MHRIAITGDIHSNIYALSEFMNYIEDNEIKYVLNLGDFLQFGPHPCEVFDTVMDDRRFVNILGNNDYSLIKRDLADFKQLEKEHQEWVIKNLGEKRINRLKGVPKEKTFEITGKRFKMVHSRFSSMVDMPLLYQDKGLMEFLSDYGCEADYILFGHTHLALYIESWQYKPVISPGSLGCSADGTAKFIVIEMDGDVFNLTYKHLKYDRNKVLNDLEMFDVPDRERIVRTFF